MRLPQADETLRGGWWWGPSAPFLRDVEVAAHPVSLLGGENRKSASQVGQSTCCPGTYRSGAYTHAHRGLHSHTAAHASRSLWRGKEGTQMIWGQWKKPNTERWPQSPQQGRGCAHILWSQDSKRPGPASDQPNHFPSSSGPSGGHSGTGCTSSTEMLPSEWPGVGPRHLVHVAGVWGASGSLKVVGSGKSKGQGSSVLRASHLLAIGKKKVKETKSIVSFMLGFSLCVLSSGFFPHLFLLLLFDERKYSEDTRKRQREDRSDR